MCCGPKAPYCSLFIDHPATDLRVWLWQTWQRKIVGILVWETDYWTSRRDFAQNPYEDPMGYVDGSRPERENIGGMATDGSCIRRWRPPRRALGRRAGHRAPVSSIRWEMLREGIEDYEYLWLLRDLIGRRRPRSPPRRWPLRFAAESARSHHPRHDDFFERSSADRCPPGSHCHGDRTVGKVTEKLLWVGALCYRKQPIGQPLSGMIRTVLRRAWPSLALAALLLLTAAFPRFGPAISAPTSVPWRTLPAHWLVYPLPAHTGTRIGIPLDAIFRRSFSLASVPATAALRVRAFRHLHHRLNGKPVPARFDSSHWKQESRFDVARFLQAGENDLAVTVTNASGPPALVACLSCPETVLVSDKSWQVSLAGATWLPAALAADPVPFGNIDRDGMAEKVIPSVGKVWPTWLIFARLIRGDGLVLPPMA